MESVLLGRLNLGVVVLALVILGAIVLALVLFLRQNRRDLDVLKEEVESEQAEDKESADDYKPGGRP